MASFVPCPTCRGRVPIANRDENFPFCSDRCRLIDLGAWMDGSYSIPVEDEDGEPPLTGGNEEADEG